MKIIKRDWYVLPEPEEIVKRLSIFKGENNE